jgi:hypothetical protein
VKTATAIQVEDPILLTIDDPRLFEYPWIYFVEPSSMKLPEADLATLREYFLRGGSAYMDDFHGQFEWDAFVREMKRLFPDREIVEIPKDHPVFSCFYKVDGFPQVAGLGSFLAGRSWEKGGVVPHLRTILDDTGRPMVFINFNTDMGDGWSGRTPKPILATSSTPHWRTAWGSTRSSTRSHIKDGHGIVGSTVSRQ